MLHLQSDNMLYLQKTCLELVCPYHEVKLPGRCISVVKQIAGVSLQFQMSFIFDRKMQTLPLPSLLIEAANNISATAIDGNIDDICESEIIDSRVNENEVNFSVYVAIKLTTPTNLADVFDNFQRTLEMFNNEQVESGNFFKVKIQDTEIVPFEPNLSRFIAFPSSSYYCTDLVAVTNRQLCRLVLFQNYELVSNDFDLATVGGIQFAKTEYFFINTNSDHPPSIGICEDTYVEKLKFKLGDKVFHNQDDLDVYNSNVSSFKGECVFVILCIFFFIFLCK